MKTACLSFDCLLTQQSQCPLLQNVLFSKCLPPSLSSCLKALFYVYRTLVYDVFFFFFLVKALIFQSFTRKLMVVLSNILQPNYLIWHFSNCVSMLNIIYILTMYHQLHLSYVCIMRHNSD